MKEYQVLARKYRPQTFKEVLGQDAIVTTLKNAIKQNRLAHGYLFCGSRGTGKTTLARVFAKALNCQSPTNDFEPCNECSSCKEITHGHSLDVLEIDGASHRGIDDIRQINENVGYTASSGKYKIYIIDEVHMLTKEAFNALLKTLEEPPEKVKFFFATTEPHKVLPTILSRCQRFNLNRIPVEEITKKLKSITEELNVSIEDNALRLLAIRAEGGLRDAESLLDQIIAFSQNEITTKSILDILGMMPKEHFFKLDQAGKEGHIAFAFELAHLIFSEGKDILHFVESLNEHFRTILMVKLSGVNAEFLNLSEIEKEQYIVSQKLYTEEQCISILEMLVEAQNQIRYMNSPKMALESLLIRIIRMQSRIPIDFLVRKLTEMEERLSKSSETEIPTKIETKSVQEKPVSYQKPIEIKQEIVKPKEEPSLTVDPTPSKADLGIKEKKAPPLEQKNESKTSEEVKSKIPTKNFKIDTVLQFAAVELEGIVKKTNR